MSEIDRFKHQCIGIVECPSRYAIVGGREHRNIPIYRIDEDAPNSPDFRAKRGDILLGGGSGESPALRISMPEAIYFYTHEEWDEREELEEIQQAYWTMNDAYIFCEGYVKLGWSPEDSLIEIWLAEHILAFVLREYPTMWPVLPGPRPLEQDGSICRRPTEEEIRVW